MRVAGIFRHISPTHKYSYATLHLLPRDGDGVGPAKPAAGGFCFPNAPNRLVAISTSSEWGTSPQGLNQARQGVRRKAAARPPAEDAAGRRT